MGVWLGRQRGQEDRNMSAGPRQHGLKEQFTPYYRSDSYKEVPTAMPESRSRTGLLSACGLVAILVSLGMIVMGLLHAAPIGSKASGDGVTRQNCTVIQDCGCPGEPMIPWYLIVGGCLTIILVLGRFIWQLACLRCNMDSDGVRDKGCKLACLACQFSCLTLYDILALTATTLCLITGTKFVLALHERKNYSPHNPNQDTCDWGLYWFTFIIIIAGWCFIIFSVLCGLMCRFFSCFWNLVCCKPCKDDEDP